MLGSLKCHTYSDTRNPFTGLGQLRGPVITVAEPLAAELWLPSVSYTPLRMNKDHLLFLHTKECLEVWFTKGWPQLTFYSLHTRECQKVIFNFVHTTAWPEGTYFLKDDEFVSSTSLSPVTYCG